MAVYLCQCDLILSTPDPKVHCPRCGHPLVDGDRLFVGNPTPTESSCEDKPAAAEPTGPAGSAGIAAHNLYGCVFAIAHIRAIGQALLGG